MASAVTPDSRLNRLNGLSHAIAQHQGRTAAFKALDPQDRTRILSVLKIAKFDWTTIEGRGLKGRIQKELSAMTKELRALSAKTASRYSFPFALIPKAVMTTMIGPYLTGKDLAAFHASCQVASKFQNASHIIHHYHLEPLFNTYLHSSSATLTEIGKAKLLDELMTFAYNLSEIEKLARPNYRSLTNFFELVEARNLIRMVRKINSQTRHFQDIGKIEKFLKISKDHKKTVQKAKVIRNWLPRHQNYLMSYNDVLELDKCRLSLLPKEIGQLKALRNLYLNANHLVSLPKEIGQLQALRYLELSSNHLVTLPKEIGQLQALLQLFLYNNHLVSLPKEVGQLQALEILSVTENYIAILPKEIGKLKECFFLLKENGLVKLPKELEIFNDQLKYQNKKFQLKNLLDRMMLYLKDNHNCRGIRIQLARIEELLGKKTRSRIEHSLYEVCKKESKTDPKLRAKLKDPKFKQRAFADKEIGPKYKAMAIAQFWKTNKK